VQFTVQPTVQVTVQTIVQFTVQPTVPVVRITHRASQRAARYANHHTGVRQRVLHFGAIEAYSIASNGSGSDVALLKLWRTRSVMLLVKKVRTTKLNSPYKLGT
jgi:hypothetical protein